MHKCFATVQPFVDNTIRALAQVKFRDDPIAGRKHARATSIVSSAYKRHGKIIERAIIERLRQNNRLSVWTDEAFAVSHAADGLMNASNLADCLLSQLPYGEVKRALQTDMIVYDERNQTLRPMRLSGATATLTLAKSAPSLAILSALTFS
jgi:hypothetical protein